MSEQSVLRTDIIDPAKARELKDVDKIKVDAETRYVNIVRNADVLGEPLTSIYPAKNIIEAMELIRQAILEYQDRENKTQDARVEVTYEGPDSEEAVEVISIEVARRLPGQFGKGPPWTTNPRARKPIFRQEYDDPDYPGYKRAVLGFVYDNTVRLKCWARTNRAANERSIWLEGLMFEYGWFFEASGIQRFLYEGRQDSERKVVKGNNYVARVIDYFVRTERLTNVSQKTLEELHIKLALASRT